MKVLISFAWVPQSVTFKNGYCTAWKPVLGAVPKEKLRKEKKPDEVQLIMCYSAAAPRFKRWQ